MRLMAKKMRAGGLGADVARQGDGVGEAGYGVATHKLAGC